MQKLLKSLWARYKILLLTVFFLIVLIIGIINSQILPKSEKGQKSYLNKDTLNGDKLPRGWRNNNPGNLRYSVFNDWKGKVPISSNSDGDFEQFVDFRSGVRAMIIVLIKKIKDFGNLNGIINSYAPSSENNTTAYINAIAIETGFSPLQALSSDRHTLRLLVIAMSRHENGKKWAVLPQDFESAYTII